MVPAEEDAQRALSIESDPIVPQLCVQNSLAAFLPFLKGFSGSLLLCELCQGISHLGKGLLHVLRPPGNPERSIHTASPRGLAFI